MSEDLYTVLSDQINDLKETINRRFDEQKEQSQDHEKRIRNLEDIQKKNQKLNDLEGEVNHIKYKQDNCDIKEVKENQEKLEKDFQTLRLFLKKPKLLLNIIVGAVILSALSLFISLSSIWGLIEKLFS